MQGHFKVVEIYHPLVLSLSKDALSLRGAQPLMVSLSNHVAISLRLNTRRQITIPNGNKIATLRSQ